MASGQARSRPVRAAAHRYRPARHHRRRHFAARIPGRHHRLRARGPGGARHSPAAGRAVADAARPARPAAHRGALRNGAGGPRACLGSAARRRQRPRGRPAGAARRGPAVPARNRPDAGRAWAVHRRARHGGEHVRLHAVRAAEAPGPAGADDRRGGRQLRRRHVACRRAARTRRNAPRRAGDPAHVSDCAGHHPHRVQPIRVRRLHDTGGRAGYRGHHRAAPPGGALPRTGALRHRTLHSRTAGAPPTRRLRTVRRRTPRMPRGRLRRGRDRGDDDHHRS